MGIDTVYTMHMIMYPVMTIIVVGVFVFVAVRGIKTWNKNNHSPKLVVDAVVATKRTQVSHGSGEMSTRTIRYFATFEVESGDRIELPLSGSEYGMLAQGDRGRLTFQGTRYLGFERHIDREE